jgi:Subtilisin-like serine proteases
MTEELKLDWVVVERAAPSYYGRPQMPGAVILEYGNAELAAVTEMVTTSRVETMTVEQATETAAAENVLAVAIDMPLMLIKSVTTESAEEPAEDDAWGISAVGVTGGYTGKGTTVAVLDTGIDANHPAFAGVEIIQRNFTNGPDEDEDGHGTHCAGTIFGRDVGGRRIGVARGVDRALIGKVIGGSNGGSTQTLVKAVMWAQSMGADVISMSLGMDFPGFQDNLVKRDGLAQREATSIALEAYRLNFEMFDKLSQTVLGIPGLVSGSVVVSAAGNESKMPTYSIAASPPSNSVEFISVAAVTPQAGGGFALASFSNVNAKLAAPGTRILSAAPGGGLVRMNGTSMAAPHVAGVACLWYEKLRQGGGNPAASEVIEAMRGSALPLKPGIPEKLVRWGLARAPQSEVG